jgi:putative membrane protein
MTDERKEWLARAPQEALAKKLGVVAWLITAVVLILVGLMRRPELQIHLPAGVSLAFLPAFNAAMNTLAALSLIGALVAVKQGRISLHRRFIFTAMGLSVLFLLSYVVYHFTSADVIYGDANLNGSLDAAERAAVAGSRSYRFGRADFAVHSVHFHCGLYESVGGASPSGTVGISAVALCGDDWADLLLDAQALL